MALIGETAGSFYEQVHPDLVFLGATGFSLEKGVTCSNLIEAETKRRMIRAGQRICLLADSSKSEKVSLAHVCGWEDIDLLITNHMIPSDRETLHSAGVEVMTP